MTCSWDVCNCKDGCADMQQNTGEKIWGRTTPLIVTPLFEMHRLDIKPWHRCSRHVHRFKHNAFYILSGSLYVDSVLSAHANFDSAHMLKANDVYTIAPGVDHQFRTGGLPCVALEMYYTEPLSEDIVRRNIGGGLDADAFADIASPPQRSVCSSPTCDCMARYGHCIVTGRLPI